MLNRLRGVWRSIVEFDQYIIENDVRPECPPIDPAMLFPRATGASKTRVLELAQQLCAAYTMRPHFVALAEQLIADLVAYAEAEDPDEYAAAATLAHYDYLLETAADVDTWASEAAPEVVQLMDPHPLACMPVLPQDVERKLRGLTQMYFEPPANADDMEAEVYINVFP